jgi:hypothetical protein
VYTAAHTPRGASFPRDRGIVQMAHALLHEPVTTEGKDGLIEHSQVDSGYHPSHRRWHRPVPRDVLRPVDLLVDRVDLNFLRSVCFDQGYDV